MIDELSFSDVRCFFNSRSVPLRKLTLLVGENSTGKSTFLALARLAWSVASQEPVIDFNEEPFLLGSYDQIASWAGGRRGRAKDFKIGAAVKTRSGTTRVLGTFIKSGAQPQLSRWQVTTDEFTLTILEGKDPEKHCIEVQPRSGEPFTIEINRFSAAGNLLPKRLLPYFVSEAPGRHKEWSNILRQELREIHPGRRPYAFAPIRTQPKRTYDPLKETPHPEGTHVPMILARMASADSKAWKELHASLARFGKSSGLFKEVDVRRMGRKESDPFQVRVKVSGPGFNLVDVGYGVSQSLPIIVDCLRGEPGTTYLLQQPEVHLHPRAQAELGTFLATLATTQQKRFIVETHSDYLVDRVRMDIRDRKRLKAKDVIILYFGRQDKNVEIYPVELDDQGNLIKVPPGYRDFFLAEERRFLEGGE